MSDLPAPNWYTDPQNPAQVRWWDGSKWSDATRAHPNVSAASAKVGEAQKPSFGPGQQPAAAAAQIAAPAPQAATAVHPAATAVPQAAAAVPQAMAAPQAMAVPQAPAAAPQPVGAAWQPAPSGTVTTPPGSNGAGSGSQLPDRWQAFLRGRLFGVPAWIWCAAAVLVVVLVVVIIVAIPSGNGSGSSGSGPSASDAATCQEVIKVLDQKLSGTSLSKLADQVITSPDAAAPALQRFEAGVRQGVQAASADPRLHKQLENIAIDAGLAVAAAQTGLGDMGADLMQLGQDVGALDTTCGVSPPFAK